MISKPSVFKIIYWLLLFQGAWRLMHHTNIVDGIFIPKNLITRKMILFESRFCKSNLGLKKEIVMLMHITMAYGNRI
jgi:hypothetical protein